MKKFFLCASLVLLSMQVNAGVVRTIQSGGANTTLPPTYDQYNFSQSQGLVVEHFNIGAFNSILRIKDPVDGSYMSLVFAGKGLDDSNALEKALQSLKAGDKLSAVSVWCRKEILSYNNYDGKNLISAYVINDARDNWSMANVQYGCVLYQLNR